MVFAWLFKKKFGIVWKLFQTVRHIFLGILLPFLTVILTKVCKAWPAESTDSQSTCNLSAALIGGSVFDFLFFWLAVNFLFAPSISLLLSRQSICKARQRYGGVDRKNWTHGKCKGLIHYARGGGGAAGGSGAEFFFFLSRWGERYMLPQQAFSFRGGKGAWLICSKIQSRCLEV